MTYPSQPVPPPPGAVPPTPPKKGLGPLGWILIGCGGLILIGALVFGAIGMFVTKQVTKKAAEFEKNPVFAAAKLAVQVNPDLEIVSTDEEHATLTVKNKKTGEVATFSAEDAKNGHFVFKSKEGTATFDASGKEGVVKVTTDKGETSTFGAGSPQNLPSWLPVYPGGTVQGTFDTTSAEGRSAAFTVTTKDPVNQVLDYYEARLKEAGLKVEKNTVSTNDKISGGSVTANSEDQKRTASVMISAAEEGTSAIITFQEKK
jgi:hypothetical protein